jgi:hypothetical protein
MEGKGIPEEVLKALEDKNRAQMKHNWMYSFMPGKGGMIYLVGYCKICNNAFTALVPHYNAHGASVTELDVPKWGCIPLQE